MRYVHTSRRRFLVIATFCLLFGGAMSAPIAASGTTATISQGAAYQCSVYYLPPSPCRSYYAAY